MDIGDLIYVLFILFGIGISIFKNFEKNKKQKPKGTHADTYSESRDDPQSKESEYNIEDVLRKIISPDSVDDRKKMRQEYIPEKSIPIVEPKEKVRNSFKDVFSTSDSPPQKNIFNNPEVKKPHPLIADFDIKKAIVYAEIMKPKYLEY